MAYNKSSYGKGNRHSITNVHRAVKERRFYLVLGFAVGTLLLHFYNLRNHVRIAVNVHGFLMAFRASTKKNAIKFHSFSNHGNGLSYYYQGTKYWSLVIANVFQIFKYRIVAF